MPPFVFWSLLFLCPLCLVSVDSELSLRLLVPQTVCALEPVSVLRGPALTLLSTPKLSMLSFKIHLKRHFFFKLSLLLKWKRKPLRKKTETTVELFCCKIHCHF